MTTWAIKCYIVKMEYVPRHLYILKMSNVSCETVNNTPARGATFVCEVDQRRVETFGSLVCFLYKN